MEQYTDINEIKNPREPFILIPIDDGKAGYEDRTDRNLGWITSREQEILKFATVGIAGCGGMGGLLAATLLRAGIGHIKIADPEIFDVSNLNRQFGATKKSIGKLKALETARMLREIADDNHLYVFPEGVEERTVKKFRDDCDVICDEIEFWAIGARLLLHEGIPKNTVILNANSVGMGTRLFRFTANSQYGMKDILRMDLKSAQELERKIRSEEITPVEMAKIQQSVINGLVPRIPEYSYNQEIFSNAQQVDERLSQQGKAPIISTNPPMAAGFMANHVILEILRRESPLPRKVAYPPDMPGYLYFDAALMQASIEYGIWWQ